MSKFKKRYEREKEAWHLYYDILDRIEEALSRGDTFAKNLKEKAERLVNDTRIDIESSL